MAEIVFALLFANDVPSLIINLLAKFFKAFKGSHLGKHLIDTVRIIIACKELIFRLCFKFHVCRCKIDKNLIAPYTTEHRTNLVVRHTDAHKFAVLSPQTLYLALECRKSHTDITLRGFCNTPHHIRDVTAYNKRMATHNPLKDSNGNIVLKIKNLQHFCHNANRIEIIFRGIVGCVLLRKNKNMAPRSLYILKKLARLCPTGRDGKNDTREKHLIQHWQYRHFIFNGTVGKQEILVTFIYNRNNIGLNI